MRAVAERHWTPGSEVRVVVVRDSMSVNPVYNLIPSLDDFIDEGQCEFVRAFAVLERFACA